VAGQFADVTLTLTTEPGAIVVPAAAVQIGQNGQYVFVVKPDKVVEMRPIELARTVVEEAVVRNGLAPGENVVVDGHIRLFPGARVEIRSPVTNDAREVQTASAADAGKRIAISDTMSVPELCIRRPVMTTLVMRESSASERWPFSGCRSATCRRYDFPTISVTGNLPGASPETMASSVATPLEKQFSTISGIDSMSSTSALGSSTITIQFNLRRDIDGAAMDVQTAISAALRQLPPDMPSPPSFRKVNPAESPILFMTLRSPTLPLSAVDEYAETTVAQRISMVDGVAQVQVLGAQK
jgi:hypothetical protein